MDEVTQNDTGVDLITDPSFKQDGTDRNEQEGPVRWNETNQDYPFDLTVPKWFEDQVTRTPQATALIFQGQYLTFAQLT